MKTNPAFILLVVIAIIALWFLASGLYKWLGRFVCKIGSDAMNNLKDDEGEEE